MVLLKAPYVRWQKTPVQKMLYIIDGLIGIMFTPAGVFLTQKAKKKISHFSWILITNHKYKQQVTVIITDIAS